MPQPFETNARDILEFAGAVFGLLVIGFCFLVLAFCV
jgi:hypothetical protein